VVLQCKLVSGLGQRKLKKLQTKENCITLWAMWLGEDFVLQSVELHFLLDVN